MFGCLLRRPSTERPGFTQFNHCEPLSALCARNIQTRAEMWAAGCTCSVHSYSYLEETVRRSLILQPCNVNCAGRPCRTDSFVCGRPGEMLFANPDWGWVILLQQIKKKLFPDPGNSSNVSKAVLWAPWRLHPTHVWSPANQTMETVAPPALHLLHMRSALYRLTSSPGASCGLPCDSFFSLLPLPSPTLSCLFLPPALPPPPSLLVRLDHVPSGGTVLPGNAGVLLFTRQLLTRHQFARGLGLPRQPHHQLPGHALRRLRNRQP